MAAAPQVKSTMALPSTPDKRPSVDHFESMVCVKVGTGNKAKTFEIHKGLLRFYSGYFRKAIDNIESGRFSESKQGLINLPEEEADVFVLFKRWIYLRNFPSTPETDDNTKWLPLIKRWVFGDRRDIPLLQNETLDCLANWCIARSWTPADHLHYVWENTNAGSALRTYLVSLICSRFNGATSFNEHPGHYSAEIMREIITYFLDKRLTFQSTTAFAKSDRCQWHIHEEGVRCNKENTYTG